MSLASAAVGYARRTLEHRATAASLLLAIVAVTSAMEGLEVEIADTSLRPVHLATTAGLISLVAWRAPVSWAVLRAIAVGSGAVVVLGVLPAVVHQDRERVALPGLLIVNMVVLAVAYSLTLVASSAPARRDRLLALGFGVLLFVAVLQVAMAAVGLIPQFDDARLFGLGRAPGTFQEATWVGALAAFVVVWSISIRRWGLVVLSAVALVFSASRMAAVTAAVPLVIAGVHGIPGLRPALYLSVIAAALAFTPWSLIQTPPEREVSSLDSRALDQHAIVRTLDQEDLLLGSDQLEIHDTERRRTIPSTSNNVVLDLLWKQGVFGLITLTILGTMIVWWWPSVALEQSAPWSHPTPLVAATLIFAGGVFNNAWLRPWAWALYGVALAYATRRPLRERARTETMRLLYVEPLGIHGGMGHYNDALIAAYARLGHDVTVVTSSGSAFLEERARVRRWKTWTWAFDKRKPKVTRALAYSASLARAWALGLFIRADAVVIHFCHFPPADYLFVRSLGLLGVSVVVVAHDPIPVTGRVDALYVRCLRAADVIAVHGERAREDVVGLGVVREAVEVVGFGDFLPAEPMEPKLASKTLGLGTPPPPPVALIIGNLKPGKGIERAVAALAHHPPYVGTLLLAGAKQGDWPLERALESAAILGLPLVRVDRRLSDAEELAAYSLADVVLALYETGYSSGVIARAHAVDRPVIIQNTGDLVLQARPGDVVLDETYGSGELRHAVYGVMARGSNGRLKHEAWDRHATVVTERLLLRNSAP